VVHLVAVLGRVRLVPVAGEVQDQGREEDEPILPVESGQDGQEGGIREPVADHVQHGPEVVALTEGAGGHAVEGVQDLTDGVEDSGQDGPVEGIVAGD